MTKKASIFTKLALGILVVGSVAACNQDKTAAKPAATTTAVPTEAGATIVYVNQDSLLAKYDYVKAMSERLEKKGKSAQGDVESRKQAFQREVAEYQKNAQSMSAEQRAPIEQRLQKKGQEIQGFEQNASAQFQNESSDESEKLYKKISEFLKVYAKDKGYKLVINTSRASTVVMYGEANLDVTSEVVKALNEAYGKETK